MRGYKIFVRISLIISFLLITYIHGYTEDAISSSISKQKSKLSTVTKEINKKKYELNQLSRQERGVLNDLYIVEKQLRDGERELSHLREQLADVYENVCRTQRSVYLASSELEKRQNVLLKRLNAIYKYRGGDLLEILFNTDNFADISKQLYFMALIAKADTELINDIKRKKNTYLQMEKILQAKYNKISEIKNSQQKVLNRQKGLKEDRQRLLAKIQSKKSLYQQQITRLERDSLELERLIKNLEAKKIQTGKYILQGRGDLPWPVKNRSLYRGFGKYKHPKFNAYVVNKGIDILAKPGEMVTAVKEGRVVFANWFKGYGMLVIIDHGKGLCSLYAHLASILVSVNEEVSKGTPIGKVGSPLDEDRYNLHFEIRVNGEPVDPLDWLMRG